MWGLLANLSMKKISWLLKLPILTCLKKCFSVESTMIRKVSHTCLATYLVCLIWSYLIMVFVSNNLIWFVLIRFRNTSWGSSGNLNAVQIKQKRHGNGKDMKVLQEVCRHKDINACKDTKIDTKAKIIESKKTLTKAAIGDGVSQEEKINLAKRKFHERYEQIAKGWWLLIFSHLYFSGMCWIDHGNSIIKLFITASRFSYAVGSVKRSHVLREGNCMADALAKEGLNRIGGLVLTSHTFQVDWMLLWLSWELCVSDFFYAGAGFWYH